MIQFEINSNERDRCASLKGSSNTVHVGNHCTSRLFCIAFQSPVTRLGLRPYKERRAFSNVFSKHCTTYQIQFHRQSLRCLWPRIFFKRSKARRKKKDVQVLHPSPLFSMLPFHRYYVIKRRSKDSPANSKVQWELSGEFFSSSSPEGWWVCKECDTLKQWDGGFICECLFFFFFKSGPEGLLSGRVVKLTGLSACISAWSYGQNLNFGGGGGGASLLA